MPETNMVDEDVAITPKAGAARGVSSRPTHDETVGPDGKTTTVRGNVEDENHGIARAGGRKLSDSTEALLAKMEAKGGLAAHEEGDADEDEPDDDGDASEGDADGADETSTEEGAGDVGDAAEGDEEGDDEVATLRETAARVQERNAALVSELETARKTPKSQRTERETALVAAEAAYYDEGSVSAVRKFLSVITGAAHDSKDVDAELSGLYTDLTERELGVALDDNQRSLRDNARTRLLLTRDKREKAEAEKKPVVDDSADADINYEAGTKHVESLLATKNQSGTSHADEYPMLMTLAEDFEGMKPGEVIARAIRREILTGTLDPTKHSDIEMVRAVAPKINAHYDAVAKRIEAARAKTKKTDTTTPSGKKPKVAVEASKEERRSTGAPTITNATASRAPAKAPKVNEKPKADNAGKKTRKDFQSDAAWKDHLFAKHGLT